MDLGADTSAAHSERTAFYRSRSFAVGLVWALIIALVAGTYLLSREIGARGESGAALYLGAGRVREINLYSDRAEPDRLVVRAGDEVVFVAKDQSRHNIAEERAKKSDARLESGEFGEGESYSLIFQGTGEFSLYDRLNQDIRVEILIE